MDEIYKELDNGSVVFDGVVVNINEPLFEYMDILDSTMQYGFLITVYSNDHNPPHAHIRTLEGKDIAEILITDDIPQNENDIQLYRTEFLDRKIRKKIVEWANSIDKDYQIKSWNVLTATWKRFQSSQYSVSQNRIS